MTTINKAKLDEALKTHWLEKTYRDREIIEKAAKAHLDTLTQPEPAKVDVLSLSFSGYDDLWRVEMRGETVYSTKDKRDAQLFMVQAERGLIAGEK